jgi:hypothetical protein
LLFNILLVVVISGLRIYGIKTAVFQAISHIVFGAFFGAYLSDKNQRVYLWMALALTLVETLSFALGT